LRDGAMMVMLLELSLVVFMLFFVGGTARRVMCCVV